MQDNEFDELFRSKLDDFELKPLPHVWSNIDAELKTGRKKSVLAPFLSVAASIIVLVAAGIVFIPHKTKLVTKFLAQDNTAKNSGTVHLKIKETLLKESKHKLMAGAVTATGKTSIRYSQRVKRLHVEKYNGKGDKSAGVETGERLAGNSNNSDGDLIKSAVPAEEPEIAVTQTVEIANPFITKPVQMRSQLTGVNKTELPSVKPKSKLHSLGDLINSVVAKVDKRKDKFIEFTDKDEESLITGVNLGIFKIKKEEQTTDK